MLPIWLAWFLKSFEILGFGTEFPLESKSKQKRCLIILFLHCLIASLLVLIAFRITKQPTDDLLVTVNELIKFFSSLICYWLTLIEAFVKRATQRKFWETLKKIDDCHCLHDRFLVESYMFKYAEFLIVVTLVRVLLLDITELNIDDVDLAVLAFTYAYFIIVEICLCRVFYFLFFVELVTYELQMIENEVREMVKVSATDHPWMFLKNIDFTRFDQNRYKWVREYYHLVYELTECINESFGWSQISSVLFCFNILTTDFSSTLFHFDSVTLWTGFGWLVFVFNQLLLPMIFNLLYSFIRMVRAFDLTHWLCFLGINKMYYFGKKPFVSNQFTKILSTI